MQDSNHRSINLKNSELDKAFEQDRDSSSLDISNLAEPPIINRSKHEPDRPYNVALNPETSPNKMSVSYLHLLKSFLRDGNSFDEPHKFHAEPEGSLLHLANADFDAFMEKFLGIDREYNFQNWNHFAKRGNIKFGDRSFKEKKIVSEMDFTEAEKDWKTYLESLPIEKLARSACLEYQYDPEYCFNSMIDVIDISTNRPKLDKSTKSIKDIVEKRQRMIYTPRVFNDPQDSLYQAEEFPLTHRNTYHIMDNCRDGATSEKGHTTRYQKVIKFKREIYKTSRSMIKKNFFPLKKNDPAPFLQVIQEQEEDDEEKHTDGLFPNMVKPLRRIYPMKDDKNTLGMVSEKFLVDFVEVDVKYCNTFKNISEKAREVISSEGSSDLEPEEWFDGIINQERDKDEINQVNWSGEQIQRSSRFTRHKMEVTIDALNLQDLEIWLGGWSGLSKLSRKSIRAFIGHHYTDKALMLLVILNTIFLSLKGLVSDETNKTLTNFNIYFTVIFLVAYLLSIWGYGWSYLRSYFNVFDGIVIILSVVELVINLNQDNDSKGGSAFSAFRAIRILRVFKVLRLTRILRSLKFISVIITIITETVEQYLYIAIMLVLFLLIYALLGMQIYGGKLAAEIVMPRANYDTFINAFLTVLQLVTFENWTDHIVLLYDTGVSKAITLAFIISWLIIGNYVFLNLFLAMLLGGFESAEVIKSLQETKDEFKELKEQIKRQNHEQAKLVQEVEDKKVRESKNINYIIKTDIKQQIYEDEAMFDVLSEQKLKTRGTYFLERPFKHDESSLEELLYETLEGLTNLAAKNDVSKIKKRKVYVGVKCVSSLYLFPKSHPLRKFAAAVVSHEWYAMITPVLSLSFKCSS